MSSQKRIAVYPGSFDPITNGHIDIIRRANRIFDELHVVLAVNPNKKYDFSEEQRLLFINDAVKDMKHVVVVAHSGLTIDYAREVKADVIVRGLRAISDFDYEFHMATINQQLDSNVATIFITTGAQFFYINSSAIKELAKHGADISTFVPEAVSNYMLKKKEMTGKGRI